MGDITGLLWLGGMVLLVLFSGLVAAIITTGKSSFVAGANTPADKQQRLTLLIVLAPVLTLILLYYLIIGA
ncbi:hypothetical protein SAMN04488069_102372 [Hymenobacter psychrophilus]|uniref:Uncharacterized protein n=1 Tax=Hymenobacter psychrophilus TaxID=651662 RepID=A0A1H3DIB1_9BACT|nr:hypothetical protein SAMN04488069_102372 [Hymenobacter psychrophilus]